MKKFLLTASVMILTTAIFYSCTKNTKEVLTEAEAVQNLTASESFIGFSKHFIYDFATLMRYHRSPGVLANANGFLSQVRSAGDNVMQRAASYQSFGLDYENALVLRNKIDNDILQLLNSNRFLTAFDDRQTERIIMNAIDAGFKSKDQRWLDAREEINGSLQTAALLHNTLNRNNDVSTNFIAAPPPTGLTGDEAWDCLKGAAGFGTAGILGVGALKKLASEGMQAVIMTVTKWLAERAGWFGLAIMLIDFGACIYKEIRD
jgi:hypothetical protein